MTRHVLLYKDLTEKIIGYIFQIYNEIGYGFREKAYQHALAYRLEKDKIPYKKEDYGVVKVLGKPVARYYADFVIDNKVVVEIKIANEFYSSHIQQLLSYLEGKRMKVGLLFLVCPKGVKLKRLVK